MNKNIVLELLTKSSKVTKEASFHMVLPGSLSFVMNINDREKKAIEKVKISGEDFTEYTTEKGLEFFNVVKPIYLKNNKISGNSADNPGKFVGGISIKVDLSEVNKVFHSKTETYFFTYIFIWLIGVVAFSLTYRKIRKEENTRLIAVENLKELKSHLEKTTEGIPILRK